MRLDAEDFSEQPLSLCGKAFIADRAGALYWPAQDALIVADLHLANEPAGAGPGKAQHGHDTRETLARLAALLDRRPATTVIALGGCPRSTGMAERLTGDDRAALAILQEERDWIWVTGTPGGTVDSGLGGHAVDELTADGITLRHIPRPGRVTHEIAGYMHPLARISRLGHTILRPCFAANSQRLILPAFAATGGGLNILDAAFDPLFGSDGMRVLMLGHDGITPVATRLLRPD